MNVIIGGSLQSGIDLMSFVTRSLDDDTAMLPRLPVDAEIAKVLNRIWRSHSYLLISKHL
jgi:hypothetical protein